jgi:hypothetical protein
MNHVSEGLPTRPAVTAIAHVLWWMVVLVIAQIVYWAKPDPIHKCETTMGVTTHYHLR